MLSHATRVRNHIRAAFLRTEYELNGLRDDPSRASRSSAAGPQSRDRRSTGGARGGSPAAPPAPAGVGHADAA